MDSDLVYIGSFAISKTLLDVLAPLLGTLIGGLITYLSLRGIESHKWKQEKADRYLEQIREAIAITLEWIHPINDALTTASLKVSGMRFLRVEKEKYLKDWPDLVNKLSKMDPPVRLQVFLPDYAYKRVLKIARLLDSLLILNESQRDSTVNWDESLKILNQANELARTLQEDLEKEFLDTYK